MDTRSEVRTGFRYSSMPNAATHFRLLELLPGDDQTPVTGRLHTHLLAHRPSYDAVSYCWGDPAASETVVLDGRSLSVNSNCRYALWQIRKQSAESRLVWIDSICINQQDLAEKTAQVQNMGAIYQNADRVFACVGRDEGKSAYLLRTLQRLESLEPSDRSSLPVLSSDEIGVDLRRRVTNWMVSLEDEFASFAAALKEFSRRPFFSRMWIYQEMFLAAEVEMLCGEERVSMFTLKDIEDVCSTLIAHFRPMQEYDHKDAQLRLLGLLGEHGLFWEENRYRRPEHPSGLGNLPIFIQRLHRGKQALRKLSFASPVGLVEELRHNLRLQCYDPRDKIYGNLSAFDDCALTPDYTISTFELALRVLEEYSRFSDPYDCIALADLLCANLLLDVEMPECKCAISILENRTTSLQASTQIDIAGTRCVRKATPWACQCTADSGGRLTAPFKGPRMSDTNALEPSPGTSIQAAIFASNGVGQSIVAKGEVVAVIPNEAAPGDWIVPMFHYVTTYYRKMRLGLVLREHRDGAYRVIGEVAFSPNYQPCISWENCDCQFGPDHHTEFATSFTIAFDCDELLLMSLRLREPFAEMQRDSPDDDVGAATLPASSSQMYWRKTFATRRDSFEPLIKPFKPRHAGE